MGPNRDDALSEDAAIAYSGTSMRPVVDDSDTLTLSITGNTVNSAEIAVVLTYATGAIG